MDTNRVRKPHLCGNTMEFYQRNGNQRRHYHRKLQGCGILKPYTYAHSNTNPNTNSNRNADT